MDAPRYKIVLVPAPAALVALAVMMPLAAAGSPVPLAEPPYHRAETLAQRFAQAARQFCGQTAAQPAAPALFTAYESPVSRTRCVVRNEPHVHRLLLSPITIDLPPPAL
jgi:hypothetical protein